MMRLSWLYGWFNVWFLGIALGCIILAAPIGLVFVSVFFPQTEIWQHLYSTVLSDYIVNSLVLAFGVGFLVIVIGTVLAWCIARYEFAGRKQIQWLILLPMAMPAYIIAYTYTGLLDFAGPIQTFLRETFHWQYFSKIIVLSNCFHNLEFPFTPHSIKVSIGGGWVVRWVGYEGSGS